MTTSKATVRELLRPVLDWLAAGGDSWQMDLAYWRARRPLMSEGEMLDGESSPYLSNIDVALDSFNPDVGRHALQIDEPQLRQELEQAIAGLRELGYLADE